MGRRRKTLPTSYATGTASHQIALYLERQRSAAGIETLQEIAEEAQLPIGAVRRVFNAEALPDFAVIEAIAKACSVRPKTIRLLRHFWCFGRSQRRPSWYRPPGARLWGSSSLAVVEPELMGTFAELRQGIQWLLFDGGSPSTRELQKRARFNVLPHTTLERTLKGLRRPSKDEVVAIVEALHHTPDEVQRWADAWENCSNPARFRRLQHEARVMAHALTTLGEVDQRVRDSIAVATALDVLQREGDFPHAQNGLRPFGGEGSLRAS